MDLLDILRNLFGAGVVDEDDLQDPRAVNVDAVPGDHIAAKIEGTKMWHHAIYIGQVDSLGMAVEMTGKTADDTSAIAMRPLKDFGVYLVVKYSDDQSTKEALKASKMRAKRILEAASKDSARFPYNIVKNSCETLAIFCRTGKWVPLVGKQLHDLLAGVQVASHVHPKDWMRAQLITTETLRLQVRNTTSGEMGPDQGAGTWLQGIVTA